MWDKMWDYFLAFENVFASLYYLGEYRNQIELIVN